MSFFRKLAAAALLAAAPVAFALPAAAETVLHRGNGAEPKALDPHKITGQWENNIVGDMMLGLMTEDAEGKPIYGAATSYETSEDGLTWTWRLREGAVWSDGTPVTAHDFVYALRRINDPKTAAEYASVTNVLKNATKVQTGELPVDQLGVRAVDDMTLEMTLEHPAAYMPALVTHPTFFPVPRHVIEQTGDAWTQPGSYVSNGAYVLKEWRLNDAVEIVKSPTFYDAENVKIDRVVYYGSEDTAANVRRFRAGELDTMTPIPGDQVEQLREDLPEEVRIAPFILTQYISFNLTRKPFDDVRVRTALSMAIDRAAIVDTILKRGERVAYSLVPDVLEGYGHEPQAAFKGQGMPERIEAAKALLAEAGFGPGNPLSFQFSHAQSADAKRIAAALQDMWKQIGVEATLAGTETKVMYDNLRVQNYDVSQSGWIADFPDAKNYLFLAETRSGQMNYTKYSNPEFDALVLASDNEKDAAKRMELLQQAEQILLDDLPMTPMYFGVSSALVRTYVTGYVDNPVNIHRSRWMAVDGERYPLN